MTKPHRCPSCNSRALVLFRSVECANRSCIHWDKVTVDTPAVVKTGNEPKCCGEDMSPFLVMGASGGWHCWTCGRVIT